MLNDEAMRSLRALHSVMYNRGPGCKCWQIPFVSRNRRLAAVTSFPLRVMIDQI